MINNLILLHLLLINSCNGILDIQSKISFEEQVVAQIHTIQKSDKELVLYKTNFIKKNKVSEVTLSLESITPSTIYIYTESLVHLKINGTQDPNHFSRHFFKLNIPTSNKKNLIIQLTASKSDQSGKYVIMVAQ